MLTVFNYQEASGFLRDAWEEKKKRNPAFSMRAWARSLGLEGHAPLHLMMKGQRPIPKKYLPKFIESLGLSAREGMFFETLTDLKRARSMDEKNFYLKRLRELRPSAEFKVVEVEAFKVLSEPLHTLLLEMTALAGASHDPKVIAQELRLKATPTQVAAVLERLVGLGLLLEVEKSAAPPVEGQKITAEKKYRKTNRGITSPPDVTSKGVQQYHKAVSQWAIDLISQLDVSEREFNSYALNIRRSSLPRAKELIRTFVKEFHAQIEAPEGDGEETYQLNIQFFGLTKRQRSQNARD
jgi:uncharacterized protein (TIGR02147 family)